jgi:quinoprotein glucose dehydrogenase
LEESACKKVCCVTKTFSYIFHCINSPPMKNLLILFLLLTSILIWSCQKDSTSKEWREYLGGPDRNHFSTLDQINIENVKNLKVAWEYHTADSGQLQCNPIIAHGILYAMTASVQPFALDAATGKELWRIRDTLKQSGNATSRGVAYWESGDDKRILYTSDSWLYAVNAENGKSISDFGNNGRVSLSEGLYRGKDRFVISNTPGTIFEDLIIMPLRLSEGLDAAHGAIQAFNVRTGKGEWIFKTIPEKGEPGSETWPLNIYDDETVGAANNWSGMAIDRARGILYVPTGSAAFDFYGGNRKGANLFANTLLALDANTGKRIWHYQFVHHDILDRDAPAPPNLLTVTRDGKKIDAVAQVTKQGFVFLFDRENGTPLFEIKEEPMPASDVPGEEAWPTQPIPVKPEPFARQTLTQNDINPNASNKDELISKLKSARSEGPFTPLAANGSIIYPGLDGGAEWGGSAVDPQGIIYINSNEMAWLLSLNKKAGNDGKFVHPGQQVYANYCSSCHGAERNGNPASGFPSLVNVNNRFQRDHVLNVIAKGKGMMPAFKQITDQQKKLLVAFLYGDKVDVNDKVEVEAKADDKTTYRISGYTKFLDSNGNPAVKPPWGTLNAIDLNTGEYVWKKTFGSYPELDSAYGFQTGSESYGGPIITAGGVLLIAGTKDKKFRAYNKSTGDLIWETVLPAAAFATPSTYEVDGKQYVVIACGGTKLRSKKGESYIAFALP